jgi:hypothetical protein
MTSLFSIVLLRMTVLVCVGVAAIMALALWLLVRGGDGVSRSLQLFLLLGMPATVVAIALLVAIPLIAPWRYTRDIANMRAGHALVHWRYDEAEWRAANRVEGRRNRRSSYTSAAFGVALGLVVLLIGLAVDDPDDREVFVFTGALTAGCSLVAILTILSASADTLARRKPTGEIYISPLGIYRNPGGYVALRSFGVRVRGVEFVEGTPPVVRFDTQVQQRYGSTREHWADVAVPAGREDEARHLVDRFRTHIG